MADEKVFTTAVIVMPPKEQWDQIQEIRERHDKAYQRWMPHINMLYPFVTDDQFTYAVSKLKRGLRFVQPFTLRFEDFSHFDHGKSNTMYLKPETQPAGALKQLQGVMEGLFPQCSDLSTRGADGFTPHLTVGQFVGKIAVERQKEVFRKTFKAIEFQVTHIHLISRSGNDPFIIKHSVALGGNEGDADESFAPTKFTQTSADMMDVDIVDEDLRAVVTRFKTWLRHMNSQGKLPKTRRKLLSATESICTIQFKVSTVDKVYNALLAEGYFKIEKDKITYLKPPSHNLRNRRGGLLSDEEAALEKCREWVFLDSNSPGNPNALKHSLDQLLLKKTMVDQQVVLNHLEKSGTLTFDDDDKVNYKL